MTPTQQMQHYATLSTIHDALALLVREKLISQEEHHRMVRRWMDERPEFTKAVEAAIKATPVSG